MGDVVVGDAEGDFARCGGEGGGYVGGDGEGELACGVVSRGYKCVCVARVGLPRGPLTSTAVVGVSTFRDRALILGRSMKRSVTSGGMAMGSRPTRDECDGVVEKRRIDLGLDKAGTRKLGISFVCEASRRSFLKLGRRPVQAMLRGR